MPTSSSRPPAFASRPSVDLAGRAVALSPAVPAAFDRPLEAHHRLIGRWIAARGGGERALSRAEARAHIEGAFEAAVLGILRPIRLADLRIVVARGGEQLPPALMIVCETVGQIDLGWIEKANVLANTMEGPVAPVGWRAAAYQALATTLPAALPVFGFDYMMEEMSRYWDGETDDEGVIRTLTEWQGVDPDEIDPDTLPSAIMARRPDWMIAKPAPFKDMPGELAGRLRALRDAHKALRAGAGEHTAWCCHTDMIAEYVPAVYDCSDLPPLTIVPADHFARELDDIAQTAMQVGFMDVAGIYQLPDVAAVDGWFASLAVGAQLLAAAQAVIDFDPFTSRGVR